MHFVVSKFAWLEMEIRTSQFAGNSQAGNATEFMEDTIFNALELMPSSQILIYLRCILLPSVLILSGCVRHLILS